MKQFRLMLAHMHLSFDYLTLTQKINNKEFMKSSSKQNNLEIRCTCVEVIINKMHLCFLYAYTYGPTHCVSIKRFIQMTSEISFLSNTSEKRIKYVLFLKDYPFQIFDDLSTEISNLEKLVFQNTISMARIFTSHVNFCLVILSLFILIFIS